MCPTCTGNWTLSREPTTSRWDYPEKGIVLLQCGVCQQWFEYDPMDRKLPQALERSVARERYPEAVPLSEEPDDGGPRL